MVKRFVLIIFILSLVWVYDGGQAAGDNGPISGGEKIYRVGIQMEAGRDECIKKWQPLADYLSRKIPGCSFSLIPLRIGVISYAIENGDIDFVVCNPAFFAIFCQQRNASQLATRINNDTGKPFTRYAGTIFCRADNDSIYSISDLKGKNFAYPNPYSLGGWMATHREMLKQNFNPKKEIRELKGFSTQEEVVLAVLNGSADAGTVRSDVLEIMAKKKLINLRDFRVINRKNDDFPLPHSTDCYPEWGFVRMKYVPDDVARNVAISLLQLTPHDQAALAAEIAGWTSPENNQQVIQCLEELQIGPYSNAHETSWTAALKKYWVLTLIAAAMVLGALIAAGFAFKSMFRYRRLRDQISQRQDRIIEIFNNIREGLAYCNERDEIIYVNEAFCKLLRLKSEELVLSNIFHRLPADLCPDAGKLLGEYRRHNSTSQHEMTYCINGVDVIVRIKPFYAQGKYHGSLFCLCNAKELMAARRESAAHKRELGESIRRSNRLAARAMQASKSKADAIAALNRDIRTPLTGIMGLINVLENTDLQPQQKNYVDILKNTTETLVSLLDKTLDMSRLETQEVELERILFNVRDEISQIEELFRFRAEEKGLMLSCTVDKDVPQKICNSPDRLRQVLINLLNNAVGYTDKGKVNLRVITGDLAKSGCEMKFIVSDTGMGISPEKLQNIFMEATAETGPLNVHRGSGLGLVISSKIAKLMGGSLEAESSPGIGSTFTLTILDFHGSGGQVESGEEKPSHRGSDAMLEGLNVLIAEDNQVNRLVLDQILLKHGCRVTCVENGRAAVEEISNGKFDLVLMDCHMPVLDGFEATLEIRRLAAPLCDLPILAITANALPQIKDYCFRCGMNGYVSKPFSAETLKAAIVRCLSGAGAAAIERQTSTPANENIDVDQQALIERIGKSGDVMKRVVHLFLEDCTKSLTQLRQCYDNNDMAQAALVAHSLKGSSALAGAARIQNAAMEAEQAALDANREYLGKVLEIIEECFKKYKSAVATCI